MDITTVPISALNEAKYNPRKDLKPGDKEYEQIKNSIGTFGYIDPIIWNRKTGNVIGGHQRLKVLRELGVETVQVVEVDFDEEKEKACNIALNKISGEWDAALLSNVLDELQNSIYEMENFGIDDSFLKSLNLDIGVDESKDVSESEAVLPDTLFQVVVECESEEDQKEFYQRMVEEGRKVKFLNI